MKLNILKNKFNELQKEKDKLEKENIELKVKSKIYDLIKERS